MNIRLRGILTQRFRELDLLPYFIGEKDSKESERLLKDSPNKTYLLRYQPGYEVVSMSSLRENDKNNAVSGKIYVSDNGTYIVRDPTGQVNVGNFDKSEFRGTLSESLKDEYFILNIIQKTLEDGYTDINSCKGYWLSYKDNDKVHQISVIHPAHVTERISYTLGRGQSAGLFTDIEKAKPYVPPSNTDKEYSELKTVLGPCLSIAAINTRTPESKRPEGYIFFRLPSNPVSGQFTLVAPQSNYRIEYKTDVQGAAFSTQIGGKKISGTMADVLKALSPKMQLAADVAGTKLLGTVDDMILRLTIEDHIKMDRLNELDKLFNEMKDPQFEKNSKGYLEYAVENEKWDAVRFLLEHNATPIHRVKRDDKEVAPSELGKQEPKWKRYCDLLEEVRLEESGKDRYNVTRRGL